MFDIAIIGGGLVGASLAAALAPTSLKLALIESKPLPTSSQSEDYDGRSIALSYQSKKIFQGIGVWDDIAPHAQPINTVHVSEQGRLGVTRLKAVDLNAESLGFVVMYRHIANAVLKNLEKQKNLTLFIPSKLTEISSAQDRLNLELSSNNQKTQSISTKLLAGADGGLSSTRTMLRIPAQTIDYQQQAIVANITVIGGLGTEAYERFTANGPMALLPLEADRFALVWSGTFEATEKRMALDEQEFIALLQSEASYRIGKISQLGKREVFPLRQLVANRLTSRRTVLVGNAAHLLHPIAGQGLNLALRDVAALAELVTTADDPGANDLVQQFSELRMRDIKMTSLATHSLIQLFGISSTPLSHLRGASLGILDKIPALKNRLALAGMGFRQTGQGNLFDGKPLKKSVSP